MRSLNYQLKQLGRTNRDGSYATQAAREKILAQIANQLHALGFLHLTVQSLKPKHVQALVDIWKYGDERRGWAPISTGATKNRMAVLRWWAKKVYKPGVVADSNRKYGIPDRKLVSQVSKAIVITEKQLEQVRDPYVRMSLELQREFGLRREEAIKFVPSFADRGDTIGLKSTWTKGGKERELPVRTVSQREVLKRAHTLAGRGSLIPSDRSYAQQVRTYERHTALARLSKMHGLRHEYAQRRYEALTRWSAPAAGGPKARELTAEQKHLDREARMTISRELGHEREQITAVYLGR